MLSKWHACSVTLIIVSIVMLCLPPAAAAKNAPAVRPDSAAVQKKTGAPKVPPKAAAGDANVKQLQQLLANTGFYPGSMNGLLDNATSSAVSWAQRTFKLTQTGKYDRKLAEILAREARRKPNTYRKKLTLEATAYTSRDPGSGNLTKREHLLRPGLVAVDPKVIPLGTRLYIEGYGYAIADDIGRAIKGARVDLAYENRKDALKFGRKKVNVLVLD